MNRLGWIIFAAVAVLLIGGLVVYSRLSNPGANVSTVDEKTLLAASDTSGQIADRSFGKPDSKVILIEYGDFQCPSCGGAYPQIKEITEEYSDRILFIFRNFPLASIHPNARAAAAAVEAAGLQGKYWEMNNLMFENQDNWGTLNGTQRTETFRGYAESLNLDTKKFLEDVASENVTRKISFDQALGKKAGVSATPTFFLNGEKVNEEISNNVVQGDGAKLKDALNKALDSNT